LETSTEALERKKRERRTRRNKIKTLSSRCPEKTASWQGKASASVVSSSELNDKGDGKTRQKKGAGLERASRLEGVDRPCGIRGNEGKKHKKKKEDHSRTPNGETSYHRDVENNGLHVVSVQ